MSRPKSNTNPLEMSDEDFLKMNGPVEGETPPTEEEEDASEQAELDDEADGGEADSGEEVESEAGEDEEEGSDENTEVTDIDEDSEGDEGKTETSAESDDNEREETSDKDSSEDDESEEKPEESKDLATYKAFYDRVMAPFKANGKMIELQSEEEVIQLMQMGANYTKKLQDIQPHRKVLLMLQNNDLLDEGKLSFLIDLEKKDPKAIHKLLKDSGIDPMDIDTESEPDYREGNHTVSDEEAQFRSVIEDVASTDAGKETIRIIQTQWDQTSKEVLWSQPDILQVMHSQRENGIYDRIVAEVDRQKTLGKISPTTPFLEAYQMVGTQLYGGQPKPASADNPNPGPAPKRELERRPAKPKPKVQNGDKAKAASTTRSSPRSSNPIVNPLEMSDEEFMKMDSLKNRL